MFVLSQKMTISIQESLLGLVYSTKINHLNSLIIKQMLFEKVYFPQPILLNRLRGLGY